MWYWATRTRTLRGFSGTGIDLDARMIEQARSQNSESSQWSLTVADACALNYTSVFSAACLLNNSLVCFHSPRQASGLFRSVANSLLPGGVFIIHNCTRYLWDQIREGLLADGLSSDGSEQLFFLDGDNRFVWRRNEQVDEASWTPKPTDRIYRVWSINELHLAAEGAGLHRLNLLPILSFSF